MRAILEEAPLRAVDKTWGKLLTGWKEGKTEDQKIRACLLGPQRDDNRVRGADDGKGKLLSQVVTKIEVSIDPRDYQSGLGKRTLLDIDY
jgi:hypothetical protein